ncbi:sensor histidine kinase [Bradyrhizobium betae]|uniref:sensor histidine kinase n=1 Tax=Bradyrhizobium betae TaxID=244734 RepID=UPI003D67B2A4
MIVVTALMAVWLVSIATFYRSGDWSALNVRPSARQLSALVNLLERAPREQVPDILDVATSSTLTARLEAGEAVGESDKALDVDANLHQAYADAIGSRPFAIRLSQNVAENTRHYWLPPAARKALEIRIGLTAGDTLIVASASPLAVSRIGLPIGFGAGLLGTLIALVALVVTLRETRPLSKLAAAVDRMDLTGAPVYLPQARASAPEIRAVITAFNRLQTRLALLLRARMALLGGISHDVRSFATRLRLSVDCIPEATERDRAVNGIADMIRLLDDSLLASRAGAGELEEELLEFDEIVRSEVLDRREAGAEIDLRIGPGVEGSNILGDRLACRRIVANLADNALKYGHVAHLAMEREAHCVLLMVDDEGPGVPLSQRDILLEPFVRLEQSRNRFTGGAGLGLAVVRSLVEVCGGTIAIGDAPSGGARFSVRLPVFAAG